MGSTQRVARGVKFIGPAGSRVLIASTLVATCASYSFAQNAADMMNLFGGLMRGAIIEGARAEWRKIRSPELVCMEEQLQPRGTSTAALAQQGIFPNDGRVAAIRVFCAKAATIPVQVPIAPINQLAAPSASQPPSLHPTFDCTGVKSALGSILCADRVGAAADWEVDTALNALKYSLPGEARDAVQRSHDDWI